LLLPADVDVPSYLGTLITLMRVCSFIYQNVESLP